MAQYYPPPPPKRSGIIRRVVTGIVSSLLLFSLVLNLYLGAYFASTMRGLRETPYRTGDPDQRIVILPIEGVINDDTAVFVHRAFEQLRQDVPKAIVLRVESGGGGVAASDRIWHELVEFKNETGIPVVASFGAYAASGGYYVSAPADYIIAEPSTITGSIGVIARSFTVHHLLEKVGITPEIIAASNATKKDMLNPMRSWTDQDRQALRSILDEFYDRFVEVVDMGRSGLNLQEVKQLATGEVFTCSQALSEKLIDEQGYLDLAIAKAKQLAKITQDDQPMVTKISQSHGFGALSALFGSDINRHSVMDATQVRQWVTELSMPRVEYWSMP